MKPHVVFNKTKAGFDFNRIFHLLIFVRLEITYVFGLV